MLNLNGTIGRLAGGEKRLAGVPPTRRCDPLDDSTHDGLGGRESHRYCC